MREKLCPQEPIHFFDIWHIVKHMYLDVGTLIYVGCCNYIFLHSQIFHFVAAQKYVWGQLWMLLQRRGSVWSRGCGGQTLLTTCSGMQLPQSGENNSSHQKKKKKKKKGPDGLSQQPETVSSYSIPQRQPEVVHNKRIHLQGLHSRPGSLALGLVHRKTAFGHHHNCQTVPLSSNFSISGAEKKRRTRQN